MTSTITTSDSPQREAETAPQLFDDWFDPIEAAVRDRARQSIEELIHGELDAVLARPRYGRNYERNNAAGDEERAGMADHRHGSRRRSLTGTFGPIEIAVPRARLNTPEGKTSEWKSQALRAYQRRTLAADALIASTYLAGMRAEALSRKPGGAVAFSRTGDPAIGEFGDAKVIRKFGEVPEDLSTL